jgi:WD40 repeat protein
VCVRVLTSLRRLCCVSRDVKCAEWHPHKSLIASCSKDATVRLWDPRTYECINTLYGHKSQVFKVSAPPGGVPALAWADRS